MTVKPVPPPGTICDIRGCPNEATAQQGDIPHCDAHYHAARRRGIYRVQAREDNQRESAYLKRYPGGLDRRAANGRNSTRALGNVYTNETIRRVIREWAAINRGDATDAHKLNHICRPLARALDALLEEYRNK